MSVHYLHTKLRVSDLDRAIAFYEAAFGYVLRKRKPGPHASLLAFLSLPGEETELQLAFYPDQGPFEVPPYLMHLALRVDRLQSVIECALKAGATLISGPYTLPSGSEVAFMRDPDGYELELIQKP
ncbi:MAG TPA: VOC family protein [Stenomitos sp.]